MTIKSDKHTNFYSHCSISTFYCFHFFMNAPNVGYTSCCMYSSYYNLQHQVMFISDSFMESIDIVFDNPKYYKPGDQVSGNVILITSADIKAHHLKIRIHGVAKTNWTKYSKKYLLKVTCHKLMIIQYFQ